MKYKAQVFDMSSKYALYHPTHGKPRPEGRKILFNECAEKLINPENPGENPPLPEEIRTVGQDRKVWKRMEVNCWHHWEPHERLSEQRFKCSKMPILGSIILFCQKY